MEEQYKLQTFDKNFNALCAFIARFSRFPERADNPRLCNWMKGLRDGIKKGLVQQEYIDKMNSIDFVWFKRDFHWHERATAVKKHLADYNEAPNSQEHKSLYNWLRDQLEFLIMDQLSADKKAVMEEIEMLMEQPGIIKRAAKRRAIRIATSVFAVKVDVTERKWAKKFAELSEYRKQNPNSWPKAGAKDEEEMKLGSWCERLRSRNRKQLLRDEWRDKLLSIGFNLEVRPDNWEQQFEALKTHISEYHALPDSSHRLYTWTRRQYTIFNKLNAGKQQLLHSVNFLRYFEQKTWEHKFAKFREFVLLHKKGPTQKSDKVLHNWFIWQKAKLRGQLLPTAESQAILELSTELAMLKKNTRDQKYKAAKQGSEKKLAQAGRG